MLEEIKKRYSPLQKRYNLPSFNELNKEFDIEKIQEYETDFLLREIRKQIGEKMNAFLRFFEALLNPVLAPLFILNSLKNLSTRDKEIIKKNYEILVEFELKAILLDIEYNEKSEGEFIKMFYKKWQEIKTDLKDIINSINRIQLNNEDKRKSYLG